MDDKNCKHCKKKGPLKFKDLNNLIEYTIVMGLKNNDFIEYLFEHINIKKKSFQ